MTYNPCNGCKARRELAEVCDRVVSEQAERITELEAANAEWERAVAEARTKIKNQSARIRELEGPTNHADGMAESKLAAAEKRVKQVEEILDLFSLEEVTARSAARLDAALAAKDDDRCAPSKKSS